MDEHEEERALALREQAKQTEDKGEREHLEDCASEAEGRSLNGAGWLRPDGE